MKRYTMLSLALILVLTALAGCGCRKQMTEEPHATVIPSESTMLPTHATEEATLPSQWESVPFDPEQDRHPELPEEMPSDERETHADSARMGHPRGVR